MQLNREGEARRAPKRKGSEKDGREHGVKGCPRSKRNVILPCRYNCSHDGHAKQRVRCANYKQRAGSRLAVAIGRNIGSRAGCIHCHGIHENGTCFVLNSQMGVKTIQTGIAMLSVIR